jgi:hypothetical protein
METPGPLQHRESSWLGTSRIKVNALARFLGRRTHAIAEVIYKTHPVTQHAMKMTERMLDMCHLQLRCHQVRPYLCWSRQWRRHRRLSSVLAPSGSSLWQPSRAVRKLSSSLAQTRSTELQRPCVLRSPSLQPQVSFFLKPGISYGPASPVHSGGPGQYAAVAWDGLLPSSAQQCLRSRETMHAHTPTLSQRSAEAAPQRQSISPLLTAATVSTAGPCASSFFSRVSRRHREEVAPLIPSTILRGTPPVSSSAVTSLTKPLSV